MRASRKLACAPLTESCVIIFIAFDVVGVESLCFCCQRRRQSRLKVRKSNVNGARRFDLARRAKYRRASSGGGGGRGGTACGEAPSNGFWRAN